MLPVYKRKLIIAGGVCIASALAVVIPMWNAPDFWNDYRLVNLVLALGYVGSYFYVFWVTAKGKGYAGWIGLLLAVFSILGIAILIFLKDRHKGESSEAAIVLPSKSPPLSKNTSSVVVAEGRQKSPIEERIVQLEELRKNGVITDEEFKIRREKILDTL